MFAKLAQIGRTLLCQNRTVKKYLTVQTEGNRSIGRHVDHYNLDMIIALGYRIDSPVAIRFRQWATLRLYTEGSLLYVGLMNN